MLAVEQAWAVEVTHWTASSGPNNQHLVDSHSIPQRKFFTTPSPHVQAETTFIHSSSSCNQETYMKSYAKETFIYTL